MDRRARNSNIELLRIISLFLIIVGHFAWQTNWTFNGTSIFLESTIHSLWIGGKLGVDIFVLISGYFLVKSHYKLSSFVRIWLQAFFYSIAILLISLATNVISVGLKQVVKSIFMFNFGYISWFVTAYLIMYLLSPFLNVVLNRLSQVQFRSLLIILLVLALVKSVFHNPAVGTTGNDASWLLVVYCFGAYIRLYQSNFMWRRRTYYFGILVLLFLSVASVFVLDTFQRSFGISSNPRFYGRFIDGFSPLLLLMASFIFILFIKRRPYNNIWINKIASTTFAIYLIHANMLIVNWLWNDFVKGYRFEESYFVVVYALGVSLLIFIICSIIDMIRQLLFGNMENKIIDKVVKLKFGRLLSNIEDIHE